MRFQSTNGNFNVTSFSEAIMTGFCPDGGLLMPVDLPTLHSSLLCSWKHLNYPSLLTHFLQYIVDKTDPVYEYLKDIEIETFKSFDEDVMKVKRFQKFSILELFHGPTLAFKDYAMFPLAFLVDKAIKIKSKTMNENIISKQNLLIATTGDTGSSALEAAREFPETLNVFVLFPRGGITETQRLQMTTSNTLNGHVMECIRSGDELDDIIRILNEDREFCKTYNISCLNSVNCGRILCQMALHIYSYLQMAKDTTDTVNIAIPCGGFGNLISACLAHSMGLPIKIILCNNENDMGHTLLRVGEIQKKDYSHHTWSNAMDTSMPYNIARLLWIFADHDSNFTKDTIAKIERKEKILIPHLIMEKMRSVIIDSKTVSDEETLETMAKCAKEENYRICPHTATAVSYFYEKDTTNCSNIVLATASIDKFPDAAVKAGVFSGSMDCPLTSKLRQETQVFSVMDDKEDPIMFLKKIITFYNIRDRPQTYF